MSMEDDKKSFYQIFCYPYRERFGFDDMFVASKMETEEQLKNADYIYELVSKYVIDLIEK